MIIKRIMPIIQRISKRVKLGGRLTPISGYGKPSWGCKRNFTQPLDRQESISKSNEKVNMLDVSEKKVTKVNFNYCPIIPIVPKIKNRNKNQYNAFHGTIKCFADNITDNVNNKKLSQVEDTQMYFLCGENNLDEICKYARAQYMHYGSMLELSKRWLNNNEFYKNELAVEFQQELDKLGIKSEEDIRPAIVAFKTTEDIICFDPYNAMPYTRLGILAKHKEVPINYQLIEDVNRINWSKIPESDLEKMFNRYSLKKCKKIMLSIVFLLTLTAILKGLANKYKKQ